MTERESLFDARPPGCDCQWFENQVCDACQGISPASDPSEADVKAAAALGVDPADPGVVGLFEWLTENK